jgi:hypothetical protein
MKITIKPTFDAFGDAKKFFVDAKDANGDDTKIMVRLRSSCVVVTTAYGERVAFSKTNRGESYRDSRGKKVEKKNEWGDKVVRITKLYLSENEVKAELHRLLDDMHEADRAFYALQV